LERANYRVQKNFYRSVCREEEKVFNFFYGKRGHYKGGVAPAPRAAPQLPHRSEICCGEALAVQLSEDVAVQRTALQHFDALHSLPYNSSIG